MVRNSSPTSVAPSDLENLPPDEGSFIVVNFKTHGTNFGAWHQEDLDRVAKIAEKSKVGSMGREKLSSFQTLPVFLRIHLLRPKKELFIFTTLGQTDIFRTLPAGALQIAHGIAGL